MEKLEVICNVLHLLARVTRRRRNTNIAIIWELLESWKSKTPNTDSEIDDSLPVVAKKFIVLSHHPVRTPKSAILFFRSSKVSTPSKIWKISVDLKTRRSKVKYSFYILKTFIHEVDLKKSWPMPKKLLYERRLIKWGFVEPPRISRYR